MSDLIVFLDTCALLYLAAEENILTSHALDVIDTALLVLVSPITAWEISLKCIRGQLKLPLEPELWFPEALEHHGVDVLPLTPDLLMAANRLPFHHKDPADRFIIASAQSQKAVLVTTDDVFLKYDVEVIR